MTDQNLKLDAQGNVDIDYYLKLARAQRAEYVAQMGAAFFAKVKALFRVAPTKLSPSH